MADLTLADDSPRRRRADRTGVVNISRDGLSFTR